MAEQLTIQHAGDIARRYYTENDLDWATEEDPVKLSVASHCLAVARNLATGTKIDDLTEVEQEYARVWLQTLKQAGGQLTVIATDFGPEPAMESAPKPSSASKANPGSAPKGSK